MNYELIIPSTVWPDADVRAAIAQDLHLPALAMLNGKGRRQQCATLDVELARRFSLPQLHAAPICLNHDFPAAQPGYWLRADPVHLRIDRDRLTMMASPCFQISQQEADALVSALNALFAADGMQFIAPTPTRWYLRLPVASSLQFTPLAQAIGKNMHDCLPQGDGALQFHALINEMQMVMYSNTVNDDRDARGLPMINSVCLWGGGEYPAPTVTRNLVPILGGNEVVQALAGEHWQAAPNCAADLPSKDVAVILNQLQFDAAYGNAYEWRLQWQDLERNWFAPLLADLKSGQLKQLTLTFPDAAEQVLISKMDLMRFWRKPRLPF